MSNYGSRMPLHWQSLDIAKAAKDASPSYETFRPNETFTPQYKEMEDRSSLGQNYRIRRYPNGELDFKWVLNQIIDALRGATYNQTILPIQAALLTVVLPLKHRKMEPQQAEILTKLSDSEKDILKLMLESHEREVDNYNAGNGGGSVPGRHRTDVGG